MAGLGESVIKLIVLWIGSELLINNASIKAIAGQGLVSAEADHCIATLDAITTVITPSEIIAATLDRQNALSLITY